MSSWLLVATIPEMGLELVFPSFVFSWLSNLSGEAWRALSGQLFVAKSGHVSFVLRIYIEEGES